MIQSIVENIEAIAKEGETHWVELKESADKDIITEVCAFANAEGGKIFVGITDKGKIVGTDTSNTNRSRVQDIINHLEPKLNIELVVQDNIIIMTVPKGDQKPYCCSKGFYVRKNASTQKLSRNEIYEFMKKESLIQYDSLPTEFQTNNYFNEKAYHKYLELAKVKNVASVENNLVNMQCAKRDCKNGLVYTNAGALFFRDRTHDSFFDYAKVRCVTFKGTDRVNIIDAKYLNDGMLENIDSAMKYLEFRLNLRYEIDASKSIERKEVLEIPENALREAVTNAICHRDYLERGQQVVIEVHDNKVVITNPGELVESEVMRKVGISDKSMVTKPTQLYNLKMILAVGYKVNSRQGVHFRTWATNILEEYVRKGFAMNDELLKNAGGGQYFKELLDRIREIRASEKVFYRQVLDLFATSVDYDPKSEIADTFFKEMQNKVLYAITKHTAPNLLRSVQTPIRLLWGLWHSKEISRQKAKPWFPKVIWARRKFPH